MEVLKQLLAFPMYAAVAWLVWVVSQQAGPDGVLATAAGLVLIGFGAWAFAGGRDGGLIWHRVGQAGGGLAAVAAAALLYGMAAAPPTAAERADGAQSFSPERLAALRAAGRPVFVNMTAAWCVTCLVNEHVALSSDRIRKSLADHKVAYLKGDWTRADPAVNYGGIGGVIGHEMTHGFDDQGRQFDGSGALTDWWTREDAAKFDAAAARLNAQFDTYSPFPGVHVKGAQTTGENIADLGGLLIALDDYHASLHGRPAPVIDGLTGDQRFFLAYAQSWRDKRREDALRQQLASDVHSPEVYRVNGVVRNVDGWYAAFAVSTDKALYLAPANRVRIW